MQGAAAVQNGAVKILALLAIALAAGAAKPALRPVDLDPLTLRGTSFKSRERVKVLLAAPPVVRSKVVRADARGRFRVAFAVSPGRCDAVVVQALGARGSRATFRHDVPDCIEP
jgi:hypothetical protein